MGMVINLYLSLQCWIFLCTTILPNFHLINLPDLCYRRVFTSRAKNSGRAKNSVDPDQLASTLFTK